jgi:hypothetical protein
MVQGLPYFPALTFFQHAFQSGKILFDPNSIYRKDWQLNRTYLPGSNGIICLSIPLKGGRGIKMPISELKIDNGSSWKRDHFRTFSSVYGRSPFFLFYVDELDLLYKRNFETLLDWNLCCMSWVLAKMKLSDFFEIHEMNTSHNVDFHSNSLEKSSTKLSKGDAGMTFRYKQLFEDRTGFIDGVSILDILFNLGPESREKILQWIVKP